MFLSMQPTGTNIGHIFINIFYTTSGYFTTWIVLETLLAVLVKVSEADWIKTIHTKLWSMALIPVYGELYTTKMDKVTVFIHLSSLPCTTSWRQMWHHKSGVMAFIHFKKELVSLKMTHWTLWLRGIQARHPHCVDRITSIGNVVKHNF
jgi:hypothetical protein